MSQGAPVATGGEEFGLTANDSWRLRRARSRSVGLAVALLTLAFVLGLSIVGSDGPPWFQSFDDSWRALIVRHRSSFATGLATMLSVVGSVYVTLPVRVALVVVLAARRRWVQLVAFGSAVIVSELLVTIGKVVVDRPRPPAPMVLTTGSSFPSGHAIATAVTAFGIVAAALPRGTRRWHWIVVASSLAGLMAVSRTYLSAHWATDTIAGTAVGVACAILAEAGLEAVTVRRRGPGSLRTSA